MSKIKQLSPHEAQKIAAGEVVERPANIVKELVENSIDAGATIISVYIKDGGKQLIRVVDDGCGMDLSDAQLCFVKHATSKITCVDELEKINTFGFRGEALAAIAAVARVTLITKEQQAIEGMQIVIEENTITGQQPISANTGTDIAVKDLFYTIPVRKKFLKTRDTEWRLIMHFMHAFCLDYPSVHFKLFSEDKQIFNYAATQTIADRYTQIWQQTNTISINAQQKDGSLAIAGIISSNQHYRYDRNGIFFFVNKRWIKDFKLTNALIKGYQNILPPGRFPHACIAITIDPTQIDINIHPRKEEIRFLHPRIIEKLIQDTISQAFESQLSARIHPEASANRTTMPHTSDRPTFNRSNISTQWNDPLFSKSNIPNTWDSTTFNTSDTINFDKNKNNTFEPLYTQPNGSTFVPYNFEHSNLKNYQESYHNETPYNDAHKNSIVPSTVDTSAIDTSITNNTQHTFLDKTDHDSRNDQTFPAIAQTFDNTDITTPLNAMQQDQITSESPINIIGQFHKTYIIIEQNDGLFLVDQHAAHERILYERFSQKFNDVATVALICPYIITLSAHDYAAVEKYLSIFITNGIILESFGNNQLIVQSTPVHFKNQSCQELVSQVIGWINEYNGIEAQLFLKKIHEKLHAQMACKAAVKAGDILTMQQMKQLLTDLNETANRFTCPHGRPTSWLLTMYDIEKKFKRKL